MQFPANHSKSLSFVSVMRGKCFTVDFQWSLGSGICGEPTRECNMYKHYWDLWSLCAVCKDFCSTGWQYSGKKTCCRMRILHDLFLKLVSSHVSVNLASTYWWQISDLRSPKGNREPRTPSSMPDLCWMTSWCQVSLTGVRVERDGHHKIFWDQS